MYNSKQEINQHRGLSILKKIGLFFLILVVALILLIIYATKKGSEYGFKNTVVTDQFISVTGVTESKKQQILDIMYQCGIKEYISIQGDDGLIYDGMFGYRIKTEYANNVILYLDKDGNVVSIKYIDVYLYDNGDFLDNISKYTITNEEFTQYQVASKEAVKSVLKSPSTANFGPSYDWSISEFAGIITVKSYVDAENSFGAELRAHFILVYENEQLTSFIFDGETVI